VDAHVAAERPRLVTRRIGSSATDFVGSAMFAGRPASFASAAIASGVISGVPTICSCFKLSWTVDRALTPMTIVVIPNAIKTTAATTPPISSALRMSTPFTRGRSEKFVRPSPAVWPRFAGGPSGRALKSLAVMPPSPIRTFP